MMREYRANMSDKYVRSEFSVALILDVRRMNLPRSREANGHQCVMVAV
jgi:hypothetical protein